MNIRILHIVKILTKHSDLASTNAALALLNSEGFCIDPNTATSVISVFNGWSADAKNYHADFKNKMPVLINVWNYRSSIGNLSASRTQVMIGDKSHYRTFSGNAWSDWI